MVHVFYLGLVTAKELLRHLQDHIQVGPAKHFAKTLGQLGVQQLTRFEKVLHLDLRCPHHEARP